MEGQTEQCCLLWPSNTSGLLDQSLEFQQAAEKLSTVAIAAKSFPIHRQPLCVGIKCIPGKKSYVPWKELNLQNRVKIKK